jgi:hypothetical protein
MKLSYLYRNSYPQGAAQAFIIVVMNLIYRLYKQILYPLLAVLASASYSCVSAQVFNYDDSYPGVDYSSRPLDDRLTRLMAQVDAGEVTLEHDAEGRGYLDALLKALEINPASQVLVFSKTALKTRFVTAATPRALYFNDDIYIGFIQNSRSVEIAAMDPVVGPVFFDFSQRADLPIDSEREMSRCLRCHDTYSMTGGGVPRFLLSSVLANPEGNIVTHEISIITDTSTPLNRRWGGMYVTGTHGSQEIMGNFVIDDVAKLTNIDLKPNGNKTDLTGYLDTSPYISSGSDIVALLVLEHQVEFQNRLTRLSFESRTRLHSNGSIAEEEMASLTQPLLESMFMLNETPLTDTVSGDPSYRDYFEALGPFANDGRSLRELDLQARTFKYPVSYLVYSEAFNALPSEVKTYLYGRIRQILEGSDQDPAFSKLDRESLVVASAILRDTKPEIFN